ncbi:hypothetical protein B0H21DRAFT_705147 [Amylocystis lapponica]|nr:hypothetical protein B0H21DRAFT_705147 [Amylocystis lapponica]
MVRFYVSSANKSVLYQRDGDDDAPPDGHINLTWEVALIVVVVCCILGTLWFTRRRGRQREGAMRDRSRHVHDTDGRRMSLKGADHISPQPIRHCGEAAVAMNGPVCAACSLESRTYYDATTGSCETRSRVPMQAVAGVDLGCPAAVVGLGDILVADEQKAYYAGPTNYLILIHQMLPVLGLNEQPADTS